MDKSTFRLRVFGQLLSIPAMTVTFGLSKELANFGVDGDSDAAFGAAAEVADEQGREFLSYLADPRTTLANLDRLSAGTTDHRLVGEIQAYLLAHVGRDQEAVEALDQLAGDLSPPEVEYEAEALARVKELRAALARSHEDGAALLRRWTMESARAIDVAEVPA